MSDEGATISGLRKGRSTESPSTRRRTRRYLWPAVVFLAGTVLSATLYSGLERQELSRKQFEFDIRSAQFAASIEDHLATPLDLLRLVAAFFAASNYVSREEFATFVSPILERHPSIAMVQWMPLVVDDERAAFVAQARAEGFKDFRLQEKDERGGLIGASRRPDYLPIAYMEPLNSAVLGLDVLGNPEIDGAPMRARVTGGSTASNPFSLIEDPPDVLSVIYYKPVLRPRSGETRAGTGEFLTSGSALSDRGEFIGLTNLILRLSTALTVSRAMGGGDGLALRLIDESAPENKQLLFSTASAAAAPPGFERVHSFEFADRTWSAVLTPAEGSPFLPGSTPFVVLVVGLILSLGAAVGSGGALQIVRLRREVDRALELGQYKIGRSLGEGGMGMVYEAEHRMLARPAAIKLIHPEALAGSTSGEIDLETVRARFEREARATAILKSAHTIEIYDFGRTEKGELYYVMELLDGFDLKLLVRERGPIPAGRAIHVLRQACHSLAEAHESGLVHRDIKPANIYLCHEGLEFDFVKVLDFGLVRSRKGGDDLQLTQADTVMGTPAFMAPELIRGKAGLDGRADLYALGCVGYWLLTGHHVFDGESALAIISQHLTEEPTPPTRLATEIPEDLEAVIMWCLEKRPEDRPQSAEEIDARLAACASVDDWSNAAAREWWAANRKDRVRDSERGEE